LFDRPEPPAVVKPVATRLRAFTGCDPCSIDLSHVWRIPGCHNWPTANKLAAGRSAEPQLVTVARSWAGDVISLGKLDGVLADMMATQELSRRTHRRDLPDWLVEQLKTCAPEGQRSELAYELIRNLVELGWSDAEIVNELMQRPIGERYRNRDHLLADVRRVRNKGDGDTRRSARALSVNRYSIPHLRMDSCAPLSTSRWSAGGFSLSIVKFGRASREWV
jgi:hypothetical protein